MMSFIYSTECIIWAYIILLLAYFQKAYVLCLNIIENLSGYVLFVFTIVLINQHALESIKRYFQII